MLANSKPSVILAARKITNAYTLAYQSKVGPVEWLKPYTDVTIVELGKRGVKSLLAVPIRFVSEHIETLEEIDVEYKELALESGIEKWGRVPALGCEPSFISDLADAVIESLPYVGAMAVSNVNARQSLVPLGSVEELLAAYNSTDIIIRDASPVTVITSEAIESHLTKTTKDISKATKAPTKVKKMGEDLKRKALTEATNFQQSNAIEITRKISNEPSRNFVSKTDIHPSP
ncbi:ferrochelatase-2, chloroplastic [Lathyrus oleraceus]|nr:ferrochelatase-2, chloroplastic-like [Pisum sativum]